jgi:hypothetical protein
VPDPTRRFDAADARHAYVHHHDVGQQIGGSLDRLEPVTGLADDLKIGFVREHELEPATEQRVVIDDQHANRSIVANVQGIVQ